MNTEQSPINQDTPSLDERAAFEAWMIKYDRFSAAHFKLWNADGSYQDSLISMKWSAWQARAAMAQQGIDAEHLQKIAAVAHCGGLAGLSEAEALEIIRRVTLPRFVKSMRAEDNVRAIDAAIALESKP